MTPQALWYDDVLDALKADAVAIGGKGWAKNVGLMLWPEKEADDASRTLADCFNRDRTRRLSPEQVELLVKEARKVGSTCYVSHICSSANLSIPVPIEPEDEIARIQREVVKAADTFKQMVERLERLSK